MTLPERFPLAIIEPIANLILGYVRQIPGVAQATFAGMHTSYARYGRRY